MTSPPSLGIPPALQTARWIFRPTAFLEQLRRECGDVVTLRFIAGREFVVTSDPDDVRALFTAPPADVPTATANTPVGPLVGEHSLLTLNGPRHIRHRRLLLPAFHGDRLRAYAALIEELTHAEIDTWEPGTQMTVHPRMQSITLEVILRAVFGVEDAARQDALRTGIEQMLAATAHPAAIIGAIASARRGRLIGAVGRHMATVDRLLYEEIAYHRERGGLEDREDILSLLMQAVDEDGAPMTDVELRDELVTLLLAGHETTATSLTWAVERLLRTPHALARLADDAASSEPDDTYADAVIHETLRTRPVIPLVARVLEAPLRFGAYDLPVGTVAGVNIYGTNHNPARYDEPYAFRPERFLDAKPDTYAWVPFGGGTRRCIGAAFAQMEMRIVLSVLLQRVRLHAADTQPERTRRRNITFVPEHGGAVVIDAVDRARGVTHAVAA